MAESNAWILDFGQHFTAAVGAREVLHLLDVHSTFPVPCTPKYCNSVVAWRDRLLPVMDMASRLGGMTQQAKFIAVVGYQQRRGEYPQFGALLLSSPPLQATVNDEQACKLPENAQVWNGLAMACFDFHGEAVPVLDINRLFNTAPISA
ncbi:MAG: chemotaxis protein CheW [Gallionellaceae bacterium]|jgi:chemotaxis signal transduction protein